MGNKASFENNLLRINEIAELLQSGQISLDDSVKLYKEACVLTDSCRKMLSEAELKIITLNKDYQLSETEVL